MKSQQRKKIKLVLVRSDFMAINHWLQTGAVYTVRPYQPLSLWMKSVSNQGVIVNLEHADTDLEDLKTERGCLKEEPQIVLDDFVILNHVDHSNEVVRIFKKRMGRAGGALCHSLCATKLSRKHARAFFTIFNQNPRARFSLAKALHSWAFQTRGMKWHHQFDRKYIHDVIWLKKSVNIGIWKSFFSSVAQ